MMDYVLIALLVSRGWRRRAVRYLVLAIGLGLGLLIGISRPYLGVHYPADVVGGWTAGLAFALAAYWIDLRLDPLFSREPGASSSIPPSLPAPG
jgi:undecaprenyl-diphosphatase